MPIKVKFKMIGAAEAAANLLCEFKIAEKKMLNTQKVKKEMLFLLELLQVQFF